MVKGESFFAKASFIKSASDFTGSPNSDLPEFAFIGRSNVGKSSLINALVSRRHFAKTSNTPGRTQLLNFFDISSKLVIADLPGYGYAKVSKSISYEWPRMIWDYLSNRAALKRIFVLIDARHGIKQIDHDFLDMLDEIGASYQIIFTKTDKAKKLELEQLMTEAHKSILKRPAALAEILACSARKGEGIEELRQLLISFT